MTYVTETEFKAYTGCTLSTTIIGYLLEAADVDVSLELASKGNPSASTTLLKQAALAFAKAHLADRYRYDGTFDVSTTEYSHKGGADATIASLRKQASELVTKACTGTKTWIKIVNE